MIMKLNKSLSLLIICCLSMYTYAQEQEYEKLIGQEYAEKRIGITNESKNDITVLLGQYDLSLSPVKIKKRSTWISPTSEYDPIIKIVSETKFVKYQLMRSFMYLLFWNETKECWDIKKIKKE